MLVLVLVLGLGLGLVLGLGLGLALALAALLVMVMLMLMLLVRDGDGAPVSFHTLCTSAFSCVWQSTCCLLTLSVCKQKASLTPKTPMLRVPPMEQGSQKGEAGRIQ